MCPKNGYTDLYISHSPKTAMASPANLYPGLNDIQDTLEQYPIETSKYVTLLHEIDAKCVNLVPELNRRIDNFLSNREVSRETTPALEFQRLKVTELAQINALFEELMPSLEEKMHVSSIMLETLERISSRLDLAYEVALRNEEIPVKLRLGADNHPAMHLHRELMERIEQGSHGRHGNNAHATSTSTVANGANGTGSGSTDNKSSQALKSESRKEAMAANKRAQQQQQQQQHQAQSQSQGHSSSAHSGQRQQGQNKHNESSLERASSRKRSNNNNNNNSTGNGNGHGSGEPSDSSTKKRRRKNNSSGNGNASGSNTTNSNNNNNNSNSSNSNSKGSKSGNSTSASNETTSHTKQRTNEYGEPLYCYCNQVAYGEMVGCDGENCELEWFHLPCIGLETLPKGEWYCRSCRKKLKS